MCDFFITEGSLSNTWNEKFTSLQKTPIWKGKNVGAAVEMVRCTGGSLSLLKICVSLHLAFLQFEILSLYCSCIFKAVSVAFMF